MLKITQNLFEKTLSQDLNILEFEQKLNVFSERKPVQVRTSYWYFPSGQKNIWTAVLFVKP